MTRPNYVTKISTIFYTKYPHFIFINYVSGRVVQLNIKFIDLKQAKCITLNKQSIVIIINKSVEER